MPVPLVETAGLFLLITRDNLHCFHHACFASKYVENSLNLSILI
jgi:hypothetical protein